MKNLILCVIGAFLLVSCAPQQPFQPENTNLLHGVWEDDQGAIYCLDENGQLGLPGHGGASGLFWEVSGNILSLASLDAPGGTTIKEQLTITGLGSSSLNLLDEKGQAKVWKKNSKAARHIDGTVFYRERMALPPNVMVASWLQVPSNPKPIALSFTLFTQQPSGTLAFRTHYLSSEIPQDSPVSVNAALFYESDTLFSAAQAVTIHEDQELSILLQRTMPDEVSPDDVKAPVLFTSKQGKVYLEKDGLALIAGLEGPITLGRWQQLARGHSVEILRGSEAPLNGALRPTGTMVLHGISPSLEKAELERQKPGSTLTDAYGKDVQVKVSGAFSYLADAGTLIECASGLAFAIEQGTALPALQAAYLNATKAGEKLFVTFTGTVYRREGEEGHAHGISVDSFENVEPGKTCPPAYAAFSLENTYWRLKSLNGKPTHVFANQPEPHIILRKGAENATGSNGCNNFFMPWEQQNNSLAFLQGGATLMMCPEGEEQGRLFLLSLHNTSKFSIKGSVLEMKDDKGNILATFEAVLL